MKAIAVTAAGGKTGLVEIETPSPGAGEMRVRLAAAGVNPFDGKSASGAYGDIPLSFVPGTDGAGTVDAVGEGVSRFVVGERVFGRLGQMGRGTYAEYVVAAEDAIVARIPDRLDFIKAAAIPIAGLTALGLAQELGLSKGASLFVLGATGGVGSFLIQLEARLGIEVVATATTDLSGRMGKLGASATVNHRSGIPLLEQLHAVRPDGFDAFVDLVGDRDLVQSLLEIVRPGGKLISTVGAADEAALGRHAFTALNYRGSATVDMLEELAGLVDSGAIRVCVDRVVPLAQGSDVLEESKGGHLHGKTVLAIP